MEADKPINVPLIVVSFIVIILYNVLSSMYTPDTTSIEPSVAGFVLTSIALLLVIPLLVIWFKALWNEVIPRVTSWGRLSYIEAFGIMTIIMFLGSDL